MDSYARLVTLNDLIDIHREYTPEVIKGEYDDIIEEMSEDADQIVREHEMHWEMTYSENETQTLLDMI